MRDKVRAVVGARNIESVLEGRGVTHAFIESFMASAIG